MPKRETTQKEIKDILCRSLPPASVHFVLKSIETSLNNLLLQARMIARCDLGVIDGHSNCPCECEEYADCPDRRWLMFEHKEDLVDMWIFKQKRKADELIRTRQIEKDVDWLE